MSKHTKLPWKVFDHDQTTRSIVALEKNEDGSLEKIAMYISISDAAFIVEACNNYESLQEKIRVAKSALRILFDDYKSLADSGDAGFWKLEEQEAGKIALAALNQLEEGKI